MAATKSQPQNAGGRNITVLCCDWELTMGQQLSVTNELVDILKKSSDLNEFDDEEKICNKRKQMKGELPRNGKKLRCLWFLTMRLP